jgi:hypothetical protein
MSGLLVDYTSSEDEAGGPKVEVGVKRRLAEGSEAEESSRSKHLKLEVEKSEGERIEAIRNSHIKDDQNISSTIETTEPSLLVGSIGTCDPALEVCFFYRQKTRSITCISFYDSIMMA